MEGSSHHGFSSFLYGREKEYNKGPIGELYLFDVILVCYQSQWSSCGRFSAGLASWVLAVFLSLTVSGWASTSVKDLTHLGLEDLMRQVYEVQRGVYGKLTWQF